MTWTNDAIHEALGRLRRQRNDDGRFEAKSCDRGIGGSVWESVSAFANTNGGTLLLGISESDDFVPVKGFDPNRITAQFIEGMGDGNPQGVRLTNPPIYEISRYEDHGRPFLAIDIHENSIAEKPCYITAKGPQSGGYRRVDDKDVRLSTTEVFEFKNALIPSPADRQTVPEATLRDLKQDAVDAIIESAGRSSKILRGITDRNEQLARLNIINSDGKVRLAGLLAAGQYPQQFYPKLLIDVAIHPGLTKASSEGPRFLDRALCDGSMPEAIDQAVETVARNLRTPTFISGVGAKTDSEIPRAVLREAIANAVIHREYDARFIGESISVDVYPDRVEISNPGGLWGGVTLATIASGESHCRNATLTQLMHKAPYNGSSGEVTVEGNGSGIRFMIHEMESRALGAPAFKARPDHFTVILGRYGLEYQENQEWLASTGVRLSRQEQSALLLLRQHGPMTIHQLRIALYADSDDVRAIMRKLTVCGVATERQPGQYAVAPAESVNVQEPVNASDVTLNDTERAILAAFSGANELGIHEISHQVEKSLPTIRAALRKLVRSGLVAATAPPSSKKRKYKLSNMAD